MTGYQVPFDEATVVQCLLNDDSTITVDYCNSPFQGSKFINYLSSLGVRVDPRLDEMSSPDVEDLLLAYMNQPYLLDAPALNTLLIDVLWASIGRYSQLSSSVSERVSIPFTQRHTDLVERYTRFLASYELHLEGRTLRHDDPCVMEHDHIGLNVAWLVKEFDLRRAMRCRYQFGEFAQYPVHFNEPIFNGRYLASFHGI